MEAGGELFFEVVRSEPLSGNSEEIDFEDATGALLEFFSDRSPGEDLPAEDDIR